MYNRNNNGKGGNKLPPHDSKRYKAYKVFYESNLSKFSLLDNNRSIVDKHVEMLVHSIRTKGQLMPIVVNEKLEVIEGQHRLKACEKLGIPVAYIIMNRASGKDIAMINNSQKSWNNGDYLKHFSHSSHRNNAPYRTFIKFREKYPLSFTLCLMLLNGITKSSSAEHQTFKAGKFKIHDLTTACENAEKLLELKSKAPQLVEIKKFCLAFLRIVNVPKFSFATYLKQVDKYQTKFSRCLNIEDWISTSIAVYNYKLSKNKKISIKIEGFDD